MMKLNKHQEAEVLEAYKVYWDCYVNGDVEPMVSLLVDEYNQIGSAEAEVFFNKHDAAQFIYDTIDQVAGKAQMRNRSIKLDQLDDYVLITDLFDIYVLMDDSWTYYSKLRASTLMQKRDDGWKFVHQHSSLPDARTEGGENLAIEKITAENQQLREAVKRRTTELEQMNRGLTIERSLEKIRNRTLIMNDTDDLADTAALLYQEMNSLFALPENSRIHFSFIDASSATAEVWLTRADGSVRKGSHKTPLLGTPSLRESFEAWKNKESLKIRDYSGKDLKVYLKFLSGLPHVKDDTALQELIKNPPERIIYSDAIFAYGLIGIMSREPLNEEVTETLVRFAHAFEMTYTRFLDMQRVKAEKERTETTLENLRTTQKQLIHAEKMASLGELTAGIAHEIQNPLNFVNNFSEVSGELLKEMEEEIKSSNYDEVNDIVWDLKQNLSKITEHGHRASGIVKGMLEHSRSGEMVKELTDINQLADEYLRLSFHGLRAKDKSFNASFNVILDDTIPKIKLIPQEIGRVLLNLINNAFYAVSQRSKEESSEYKPAVSIQTQMKENYVEIRVKDNGAGIPEDARKKIFQPFYTTKPTGEGTGLGLSLSFDIITKGHGGELLLESVAGEGTEFIIVLPV